jgi:hypothetical protein
MQPLLMLLAQMVVLIPNWKTRFVRGDKLVVEFSREFRLGTIEGGHSIVVAMTKASGTWRESVSGYNAGAGGVINYEADSTANPNEGTISIFGAVFQFTDDGTVLYRGEAAEPQVVGRLTLPTRKSVELSK